MCKNLITLLATFVVCLPLFAQSDGIIVDKIIAKVNDYIILKSDLEKAMQRALENNNQQPLPPEARCQILQGLIINKMLVAKAEIDSVTVSETAVSYTHLTLPTTERV